MGSEPTDQGATAVEGTPGSASSPTAPGASRGTKRRLLISATVAVVVAALLLVAAYEGLIPGVHLPGGKGSVGSGPSGPVPYSAARAAATNAAGAAHRGPWAVVGAAAFNAAEGVALPALSSTFTAILGCTFTPGSSPPPLYVSSEAGGVGQGSSPLWLLALRNSSSSGLVVFVLNGSAVIYGTLSGTGCGGGMGLFSDVPGSIIDSTVAVNTANRAGGAAFLAEHPLANASLLILGGVSALGTSVSPDWVVTYYACAIGASPGSSVGSFDALVDATTGIVVSSGTTTTTCPTLLGGLGGVASPPLSSALRLGTSTAGTCTAPGSAQTCTYVFTISSASSGLVAADLSFSVQNGAGLSSAAKVANLTLLDVSACVVGTFIFAAGASGSWTPGPRACSAGSLTGPLTTTETLSLLTTPSSSPSLAGQGYRLVARALLGYTGSVTALIP